MGGEGANLSSAGLFPLLLLLQLGYIFALFYIRFILKARNLQTFARSHTSKQIKAVVKFVNLEQNYATQSSSSSLLLVRPRLKGPLRILSAADAMQSHWHCVRNTSDSGYLAGRL